MYTLRRISGDGVQMNIYLGRTYNYVGKEESPKEFERMQEIMKWTEDDKVYAFISSENGSNVYPLYAPQQGYVMSESGKTFANVSYLR